MTRMAPIASWDEPDIIIYPPAMNRVGDFAVRAIASSGRTGAVACGGGRGDGLEPFAVTAAPILSAGWRWARAWHPELFHGYAGPVSPLERWAEVEVEAGVAVHRAASRDLHRARGHKVPAADALWRRADRLQRLAQRMWASRQVQVVAGFTGLAIVLAVCLEGEYRLAHYVTLLLPSGSGLWMDF